jgi:hypothetical protein
MQRRRTCGPGLLMHPSSKPGGPPSIGILMSPISRKKAMTCDSAKRCCRLNLGLLSRLRAKSAHVGRELHRCVVEHRRCSEDQVNLGTVPKFLCRELATFEWRRECARRVGRLVPKPG